MSSPAELAHADETLRSLFARFKDSAESGVFIELAATLLARGHATEALRVAEHGLQTFPDSVEGRVERAAALLALGRPRVAYVELRRALAIDATHRRAMRLLGQAFVDAGAPARAAELLTRRSLTPFDDEEGTAPVRALPPAAPTSADRTFDKTPPIPELFSRLTRDLGLGAAQPNAPPRRVEVTRIIRRKGLPRPPRSASELASIEGPIVDTTSPGDIEESETVDSFERAPLEPAPLFSAATSSMLSTPLLPSDEPLFQEHLPFEVRPVENTGPPVVGPPPSPQPTPRPAPIDPPHPAPNAEAPAPGRRPPAAADLGKKREAAGEPRRRGVDVVAPRAKRSHVTLGIVGAILMIAYVILLVWGSPAEMTVWIPWR